MARRSSQFRRKTHPILASHNSITWRFIPGLICGFALKWWLDGGPKKVRPPLLILTLRSSGGFQLCSIVSLLCS